MSDPHTVGENISALQTFRLWVLLAAVPCTTLAKLGGAGRHDPAPRTTYKPEVQWSCIICLGGQRLVQASCMSCMSCMSSICHIQVWDPKDEGIPALGFSLPCRGDRQPHQATVQGRIYTNRQQLYSGREQLFQLGRADRETQRQVG